jgi:hypothetical protein
MRTVRFLRHATAAGRNAVVLGIAAMGVSLAAPPRVAPAHPVVLKSPHWK